mmetsp:Transcript_3119/g.5957  ORF Transcript_3119/g.5957 Transcript_3119/m.5957 type:complete len:338 (+) Transcript_3119:580-1593(+)
MFGRRSTGSSFVQAATGQQWDNREHFGTGSQLEDRKQIRQIITQHIARDRNSIFSIGSTFTRNTHGIYRAHNGQIQTICIMILEVGIDLVDQNLVVRALLVQPKDGTSTGRPSPIDGQANPITNTNILGGCHAPNVTLFDTVLKNHIARFLVADEDLARGGDFKRLVVRTVFFGLLRHETDIGHVTHGSDIKLPMRLAVADHFLVHGGIATIGDQTLGIFQFTHLVPHFATVTNHHGHTSVDDDIIGGMQIGNATIGIDHGQPGTTFVDLIQIGQKGFVVVGRHVFLGRGQDTAQPAVGIGSHLFQGGAVLGKQILVKDLDGVSKENRVTDFHHGGL